MLRRRRSLWSTKPRYARLRRPPSSSRRSLAPNPWRPPVDLPLAPPCPRRDPVKACRDRGLAQAWTTSQPSPNSVADGLSERSRTESHCGARSTKAPSQEEAGRRCCDGCAVAAPAEEAEAVPVAEGLPVAGVLFDTSKVDVQAATPPAELESVEHEAWSSSPRSSRRGVGPEQLSSKRCSPKRLSSARRSKQWRSRKRRSSTPPPGRVRSEAVEARAGLVAPARPAGPRRGRRRVPGARGRESEAGSRLAACGRAVAAGPVRARREARSSAAGSGPASGSGLGSRAELRVDRPSLLVADVPPPRSRKGALPASGSACFRWLSLVGLGLVLGFAAGYVRGHREKAPTVADATARATGGEGRRPRRRRAQQARPKQP